LLRDADEPNAIKFNPADHNDRISMTTKKSGDAIYAIVINESNTDVQLKLRLPAALKNAKLHVLFEDRNVQAEDGTFNDKFKPYDVHVYATTDRLP